MTWIWTLTSALAGCNVAFGVSERELDPKLGDSSATSDSDHDTGANTKDTAVSDSPVGNDTVISDGVPPDVPVKRFTCGPDGSMGCVINEEYCRSICPSSGTLCKYDCQPLGKCAPTAGASACDCLKPWELHCPPSSGSTSPPTCDEKPIGPVFLGCPM
jgi:hypothetical protein